MFRIVSSWLGVIVSSVLMLSVGSAWIKPPPALPIEIPETLMPGNPIPEGTECKSYFAGEVTCQMGQIRLFAQYGAITYTRLYLRNEEVTIGDLILSWGTPTGLSRYGDTVAVYWRNRYVYAIGSPFTPHNRVIVMIWDNRRVRTGRPWEGFSSGN